MVEPAIVRVVTECLLAVRRSGLRVSRGVVFGSHARGEARPESDIDVLVISPEFDGPYDRQRVDILWQMRARTDSRVEPFGVGERQWQEDDANPIIEIARREGQVLSWP